MNNLAHKIRLEPTFKQKTYFCKACGVARFAWNWSLAKWEENYKAGIKTNALELKKEFNAKKKHDFPWVYEVTKYASQQPFIYLDRAFQDFFKKIKKRPNFKKKGVRDSFYIGGDQVKINGNKVKIPNLGWVKLSENLRFEGKIRGVTISKTADLWFISVSMETNHKPTQCENQATVGIDLGIKTLATLSNGEAFQSPKPLKNQLKKLKRLQRTLSRRKKDSHNRHKIKKKIANLHYQITCIRNDCLHKLTTKLTTQFRCIAIEDLDISEMLKNKKLSHLIMDLGWYEFRRQLTYKAKLKGNKVIIANKWFASSKICSDCGHLKQDLLLADRTYDCKNCNLKIDRDLNAAICLNKLINTVSSTEIDACGQDGSVLMLKTLLQPAWLKQELCPV